MSRHRLERLHFLEGMRADRSEYLRTPSDAYRHGFLEGILIVLVIELLIIGVIAIVDPAILTARR